MTVKTQPKKTYSKPSVTVIGSLSEKTRGGWWWWRKVSGPGDQWIMTDPPSCWDGKWYNNCEATSA